VLKNLFGPFVLLAVAAAMPLPEAGTLPPNAAPFETVRGLALSVAAREYPGAQLGTVVPYVDENGATDAYMFHFRTDGKAFPSYDQVAGDVLAERGALTMNTDLTRWTSRYSHVLVSARRDRTPVVCFGYGTSSYYALGRVALALAQQLLGFDARLTRAYFVTPCTYLEFTNGSGQSVVFPEHFERAWSSRQEFVNYVTRARSEMARAYPVDQAATAVHHNHEWDKALAGSGGNFSDVFVPNADRAPFYDWSYGCTPTSGAMVMGYIDRTLEYGRLVDWFYQRRDNVEGENDWQIPNVQRECALDMGTDTSYGGTSIYAISAGLEQVGYDNDYTFTVTNEMGASWNDWAWATITSEIDAGHAMVWSACWEQHSLACYGYRTDSEYVYVHNTWWQPAEWWSHSGPDWAHVAAVTPDGCDVHKIELTYPLGDTFYNANGRGEVLYVGDTVHVTWNNFGHPGTRVRVELSTFGGREWQEIADSVPDNGSYAWYVDPSIEACDSVRLRLEQYDNSTYTAGDGSFGNFRLRREPMPPPQIAPPNGLPVMNPPVVLTVDSVQARCDSIEFKAMSGTDTVWRQLGTSPRCPLPDTLFRYNHTYKWMVRGLNRFGWGSWGSVWSFRVMFGGVAEENRGPQAASRFSVPGLVSLAAGEVRLTLPRTSAGERLTVFDALGNVVRGFQVPETGELTWDMRDATGRKVSAGLYFVRDGGAARQVRKLVLVD